MVYLKWDQYHVSYLLFLIFFFNHLYITNYFFCIITTRGIYQSFLKFPEIHFLTISDFYLSINELASIREYWQSWFFSKAFSARWKQKRKTKQNCVFLTFLNCFRLVVWHCLLLVGSGPKLRNHIIFFCSRVLFYSGKISVFTTLKLVIALSN